MTSIVLLNESLKKLLDHARTIRQQAENSDIDPWDIVVLDEIVNAIEGAQDLN